MGAGGALLRTTTGGVTWVRLAACGNTAHLYAVLVDAGTPYAFAVGERETVCMSADHGASATPSEVPSGLRFSAKDPL